MVNKEYKEYKEYMLSVKIKREIEALDIFKRAVEECILLDFNKEQLIGHIYMTKIGELKGIIYNE